MAERAAIIPNDGKPLRLVRAFIQRTVLDGANLARADLTEADLTGATARFADFEGANLSRTILRSADLTGARNLSPAQVAKAVIDAHTTLPDYLDRAEIERLATTTDRSKGE